MPTRTASYRRRSPRAAARAASLVIHFERPEGSAIFPSRVIPALSTTKGVPDVMNLKKTSFSRAARLAKTGSIGSTRSPAPASR